jgi:hypothetical protein
MSWFNFSFEASVERHIVGKYTYTVVFLDPSLEGELPFAEHPKLRFDGEINDHPISAAWQPVRGRHFAMLSKTLLKETGLTVGDRVEVRFRVADQEAVDMPAEIMAALAADDWFSALWQAMTAGRRRAFCHMVGDAKSPEVRARRMATLLAALAENPDVNPMFVGRLHRKARPKAD